MELDSESLNSLHIKIQEFLFKKSEYDEVNYYLVSKNLSLDILLANLFLYGEYENNVDSLVTIIDKLLRWNEFKKTFVCLILDSNNTENIFLIKSPLVKKYLVGFIKNNIEAFIKEDFLYRLLKIYLVDHNSGVYEQSLNLLIFILSNYKEFVLSIKFMNSLIIYLENLRGDDSIILIRELEIILKYLELVKEDSEIEEYLKKISQGFVDYDLLTGLTFLDTLEKNVKDEKIVKIILSSINFFQLLALGQNIQDEILRKMMFTLSKFYATKILNEISTIKNFLGVSLQYYEENSSKGKEDLYFIISVILNTFHNRDIFNFLMDPNNNSQIDFLTKFIDIIVNTYFNPDPKVKQHMLEVISILGNFEIPSVISEQFIKKVLNKFYLYQFDKFPTNEIDSYSFLVEKLYKDFRTHDFEEFEQQFLDTIQNIITYEPILKRVFANFDLILYLLNRRTRPQEILLKKFEIIKYLYKSNFALSGEVEKGVLDQLKNYVSKGAYAL